VSQIPRNACMFGPSMSQIPPECLHVRTFGVTDAPECLHIRTFCVADTSKTCTFGPSVMLMSSVPSDTAFHPRIVQTRPGLVLATSGYCPCRGLHKRYTAFDASTAGILSRPCLRSENRLYELKDADSPHIWTPSVADTSHFPQHLDVQSRRYLPFPQRLDVQCRRYPACLHIWAFGLADSCCSAQVCPSVRGLHRRDAWSWSWRKFSVGSFQESNPECLYWL
jgi:hypothetical protein